MRYSKKNTQAISFPLGGIGAGCIGLAGNGELAEWEIFNHAGKGLVNALSHFAIRAEENGKVRDFRILHGDRPAPFMGRMNDWEQNKFHGFGWGPNPDTFCGWPHFREHTFSGEYPFAEIRFGGEKFPGEVTLHAWSVMIPGNSLDSSLPAAFFEIEVENTSGTALDYALIGVVSNPWPGMNEFSGSRITFFSPDRVNDITLTVLDDPANVSGQQSFYRGHWCERVETYYNDMMKAGRFVNRTFDTEPGSIWGGPEPTPDTGLLASHVRLEPGEKVRRVFVITWSVPFCKADWDDKAAALAAENGIREEWKNFYAVQWKNSRDSADYAAEHYRKLYDDTRKFHDALYRTNLPEEVLESITSTMSVLKTPVCLRLEDGTFYGWEGVACRSGSCPGSCTHVWNYTQVLPFLFPDLERSMREAQFQYNVLPNGRAGFRIHLPLGIPADPGTIPCADGLFGDVMKSFRDWKITGDDAWLRKWYPTMKKMIRFAWDPENPYRWDPEKTGLLSGRQHHTLDVELFGIHAWLTGHYLGALLACSQMAEFLGDKEFAEECKTIYQKGFARLPEETFNGEYFIQKADLKDFNIPESFGASDYYWHKEAGEIKYQIGSGCAIDTPLAQWYCNLYGIGDVFPSAENRSTLQAIFRRNFKDSMRDVTNTWRVYCMNDEAGVQICTWDPPESRPVIPLSYNSEMMTGFEWAFACHLIAEGMLEEGRRIIRALRDRYDGFKRNPWNEIECGSNYARSMASFGLLMAFSGFRYDRGKGMLGFAFKYPQEEQNTFWSLGDVWGNYRQGTETGFLTVEKGSMKLTELALEKKVQRILQNGISIPFRTMENGVIQLEKTLMLTPETPVEIQF
ncbi:MAG: hypothetical protein IJV89_05570 [Lentisphaeria bacterium]|nr:hypothetical protein [Lentisphaeria bacterium]